MSKGWELAIGVQDCFTGFGSTPGLTSRPHWFLYVDSESLKKNAVVKERDAKLIPSRLAPIQSASLEQFSPGGEITYQPRTDDSLNVLFSFFQMATLLNGDATNSSFGGTMGTWIFTPVGKSLSWSGVAFATTSVYSVNVAKYFGEGLSAGTGDGIRFERGICQKLTIEQAPAEDLKFTPDFRFFQHTNEVVMGTGFKSQPNAIGSFSSKAQLVDWNGTLTIGSVSSYAIERIKFEFDNNVTERRKLGQKGFYQFPFGRAVLMGDFDIELDNMSLFKEGTSGGTLSMHWQTGDGDWLDIFCPNIFWKASDINVNDTGPVIYTVPFRCYPTAFGGSNAAIVSVYPKYGSASALPAQSKLYF